MKLFDDYEKLYKKFINDEGLDYQRPYKISGNIFSHLIRKYIKSIVEPKYKVSIVNAYIKGCKIEWDLLILKNTVSKDEEAYNVYDPENVVCAFEFKTSGAVFKKDKKDEIKSVEYIKKYIDELNKLKNRNTRVNIKYGYISLCEIRDNLINMRKAYEKNCFWIIEGYYRDINDPDVKKNDLNELKEYLDKLIN